MKEIPEDYLADYTKVEDILFPSFSKYIIMLTAISSLIYLAFRGAHHLTAFTFLLLVVIYWLYKELSKKCKCGKRCDIALFKKSLNGSEYSKSHHSFKYMQVIFCVSCKKYSEFDYEPPSS